MKLLLKSAPILPAVILCACLCTLAQNRKFPPYKGHINDFASVMDQPTEERLEQFLLNFENKTGAQLAVVTIQSLEGQPLEDYANGLYRAWGLGQKTGPNKDKGALLIVVIGDRKTRLEVGYGLEGDFPDGLAGEVIRRMRPDLQQGQYGQAITNGVRTIVATLAQKWGVSLEGNDPRYAYQARTDASETNPFLSLIFVAFIIIFFLIVVRAARRGGGRPGGRGRWMGGPMIFNGGGGGFGGGDWGSSGGWSGGGGGWGGFGGGSSGGGGASDSW